MNKCKYMDDTDVFLLDLHHSQWVTCYLSNLSCFSIVAAII